MDNNLEEDKQQKRKSVECPHCNEKFFVEFRIEIEGLLAEFSALDWEKSLRPDQIAFLEKAEIVGLIKSFEQAVEIASPNQIPNNIKKFLLTWFERMQPVMVPAIALNFYKQEFPNTDIRILGFNQILCVTANKRIMCFVPTEVIVGKTVRKANGSSSGLKTPVSEQDLIIWKRTRRGYVIGGSIFEDELKSISIGSFAKPRIEIKNR